MTTRSMPASEPHELALRLGSLAAEARAAISAATKDSGVPRDLSAADACYTRLKAVIATEFSEQDLMIVAIGICNLAAETLLALDFAFDLRKQRPPAQ
jgi:hypothetical protein